MAYLTHLNADNKRVLETVLCSCSMQKCAKIQYSVTVQDNVPLEFYEDQAKGTCSRAAIVPITLTDNVPCVDGITSTFMDIFNSLENEDELSLTILQINKPAAFDGTRCNALVQLVQSLTEDKVIHWKYTLAYEHINRLTITMEPIGIFELSS